MMPIRLPCKATCFVPAFTCVYAFCTPGISSAASFALRKMLCHWSSATQSVRRSTLQRLARRVGWARLG